MTHDPRFADEAESPLAALAARFPPDFLFGAATAAFQIEGAADADGKGRSVWDTFCRVPGAIATGETGEPACDHYRRYADDVALMRDLGLDAYRFSISWPRVLPDGVGRIERRGLDFYDRLVDALLEAGIAPFATLYHWDLPQALQDRGGWDARDSASWFAEYAGVVAARLGDRVRAWMTLNEPDVVVRLGHASGEHAPGLRDFALSLRVAHNLLQAHRDGAAALRTAAPAAEVGIALNLTPAQPATDSPADVAAAARHDAYTNRWYLDPLFGRDYPQDLVDWLGDLVAGDAVGEAATLGGRPDFLGVNYYSRILVREAARGPLRLEAVPAPNAERTDMGWEIYPEGLTDVLTRVWREYDPPALYVTENGAAYDGIEDAPRVRYLEAHLDAAARAIEAGAPLRGYFVWSLLDNFEWAWGTSRRFGIVHVDYETQRRTVKASGRWYRALVAAARERP